MSMSYTIEILTVIAAVITGIIASARVTRLVVADDFPPVVWLRMRWDTITRDGSWSKLVHCHWCFGPWVTGADLAWALLSDTNPAWWIVNGWLAASYAVSWAVHHDED